jgi:hypothetical protein
MALADPSTGGNPKKINWKWYEDYVPA